jgi:hypothetical protein
LGELLVGVRGVSGVVAEVGTTFEGGKAAEPGAVEKSSIFRHARKREKADSGLIRYAVSIALFRLLDRGNMNSCVDNHNPGETLKE